MNWVFEGQIVGLIRRATWENCHAFEDEEAHELIFQATTLIHKEALVTKTLQSPGSDFLTSSADISLHRDEHEVRALEVVQGFFFSYVTQRGLITQIMPRQQKAWTNGK